MNVGDLVRIRSKAYRLRSHVDATGYRGTGIITDVLEGGDGFYSFEVIFMNERGWFSDLELEVISESR